MPTCKYCAHREVGNKGEPAQCRLRGCEAARKHRACSFFAPSVWSLQKRGKLSIRASEKEAGEYS